MHFFIEIQNNISLIGIKHDLVTATFNVQGPQSLAWNNEEVRTDMPYYDKRYHIPYNPPPNEVNYIDGLGKKVGNPRSTVSIFNNSMQLL